jgi:hypothetical protein
MWRLENSQTATNEHSLLMLSRSQWPRGLKHELSSLARTLGSWVRIPLEAWMSVCVYYVFALGSGLATSWSLVQGVLPNVLDQESEVKRSASQMPYVPSGSKRNKPSNQLMLTLVLYAFLDFSDFVNWLTVAVQNSTYRHRRFIIIIIIIIIVTCIYIARKRLVSTSFRGNEY